MYISLSLPHDPWLILPDLPCRSWRYNENVSEYYIIDEDKTLHRKAERTKETEEVDLGDSWLYDREVGSLEQVLRVIQHACGWKRMAQIHHIFEQFWTCTKMTDLLNLFVLSNMYSIFKKTCWLVLSHLHSWYFPGISTSVSKIPGSFWGQGLEEGSWGFGQEFGGSPGPEASSRGGWVSGGAPYQFDVLRDITTYSRLNHIAVIPQNPLCGRVVSPWPAGCRFGSIHDEPRKETAVRWEDDPKAWLIKWTSSHKVFWLQMMVRTKHIVYWNQHDSNAWLQAIGCKFCPRMYSYSSFLIPLRLAADLGVVLKEMEASFSTLSCHITELKMDHNDGKTPSENLDQSLV